MNHLMISMLRRLRTMVRFVDVRSSPSHNCDPVILNRELVDAKHEEMMESKVEYEGAIQQSYRQEHEITPVNRAVANSRATFTAWTKPRIVVCVLLSSMLFLAAVPAVSAQSYLVQYTVYEPSNGTPIELAVVMLNPSVPALEQTSTDMQYSLDSTDGRNGVWKDASDGETPFTPSQGWLTLRLRDDPSSAFRLAYIDVNAQGSGTVVQQGTADDLGQATNGANPDNGLYTAQSTAPGQLNIALNKDAVLQQLDSAQDRIVPIVIPDGYTTVRCMIHGDVLQALYDAQGGVAIQSAWGDYVLPIRDIDPAAWSKLPGNPASLQAVNLQVEITPVANEVTGAIQQAAAKTGITIVGTPVQFALTGSAGQQPSQALDSATLFPGSSGEQGSAGDKSTQSANNASDPGAVGSTPATGVSTAESTRQLILHPSAASNGSPFTTAIRWNPVLQQIIPVPTMQKTARSGNGTIAILHGTTPDGIYALVQSSQTFSDTAKHWSRNDVNDMASRLIVNGEQGQFFPDREVTRAEFAAMLVRALGLADEQSEHLPRDVKRSDWYAGVVGTAINHGLIEGYNDGNFRPNQPITREEAAMIMSHAMNYTGQSTTLTDNAVQAQLNRFSDRSEVSNWAKKAVAATAQSSIVGGDHGQFAPQSHVTRAQSASMIRRLLQKAGWING